MARAHTYNLAGTIAGLFTRNRPLSLVVLIGIIAAGIAGYVLTPKQYNPEISRPAFEISVAYPGASAQEVERVVTGELVEKMHEIEGVDEVRARSYEGGRSVATVIYEVGTDVETAKVRTFTQIEQHLHFAREPIEEPTVRVLDTDDVPVFTAAFTSGVQSQEAVRRDVAAIADAVREVPDVANVSIVGGAPPALVIESDLNRMQARDVGLNDITRAIERNNQLRLTGALEEGDRLTAVSVDGRITDPATAERITLVGGVQLSSIADVYAGYAKDNASVRFAFDEQGERPAVYLSAAKAAGSNAPTVTGAIRKRVERELERPRYDGLSYEVVRDSGRVATDAIFGLGSNLLISIAIVGAVLFTFLSARPALVAMAAIPTTFLLVLFTGYIAGETINRITLFALILSLGLLVDSATVVVENIHRHLSERPDGDRRELISSAVHQVGVGLLLSTITSVIVFLPVGFVTGMMGPYMGPIAFFVPVALIAALGVAFVITPFLSREFIRPQRAAGGAGALFDRISNGYAALLHRILYSDVLRTRVLRSLLLVLLVVLVFPVVQLVHFQMLPKADKQQYYIYIDLEQGSDAAATDRVARDVERAVFQDGAVTSVQSFIAEPAVVNFSGLFKRMHHRDDPHQATLRVNLTHPSERARSSNDIARAARERIHAAVSVGEHGVIRVVEDPPGPPVLATFVGKVKSDDQALREQVAGALADELSRVPQAVDIDTSVPYAQPKLSFAVDRTAADIYGVDTKTVADAVAAAMGETHVGQYHTADAREYTPISLRVPEAHRNSDGVFASVPVTNERGELVPLDAVVTRTYTRTAPPIYSEDHEQLAYVTAETDGRSIVYVMLDTFGRLDAVADTVGGEVSDVGLFGATITAGDGSQVRIDWGGEWQMTLENFRDLGLAMLVAFFAVYIILVGYYRSFGIPLLIMATVPFAMVGILPGFAVMDALFGTFLTATALIGFIALIGIVVNNAIIYLEYVRELAPQYDDVRDALVEAGRVRLRPIVLTSLTTVLASITIALDPVWSGLAWSIVFGLSLSALLTLVIFPILYVRFIAKTD
jgi:multidrug efflux pump subunit AcrB